MATNLEVSRDDHDIFDYCTFEVKVVNDAQNVRYRQLTENNHYQKNLSKMIL